MEGEYDEEDGEDEEDDDEDGEGHEEDFEGLEEMRGQLDPDDVVFVSHPHTHLASLHVSLRPVHTSCCGASCALRRGNAAAAVENGRGHLERLDITAHLPPWTALAGLHS